MGESFKIYYTDPVAGRGELTEMPAGLTPLMRATEKAAIDLALDLMRLKRVVWKIEGPKGAVANREELEAILQNLPVKPPTSPDKS
jgi:hypothetical protein